MGKLPQTTKGLGRSALSTGVSATRRTPRPLALKGLRSSNQSGVMDRKPQVRSRRYSCQKRMTDEKYKLPFEYGWKREFVIRSIKSKVKLGDVYYYSPNNQKLRTLKEIQTELDLINDGSPLTIDCFTFQDGPVGLKDTSKEIVRNASCRTKILKHPVPLPAVPDQPSCSSWKRLPPSPILTIEKDKLIDGFTLEWSIPIDDSFADISSFQIFYYCENGQSPSTALWIEYCKVVSKSLPITLKIYQIVSGLKYYFSIRAIDVHCRVGPFCTPGIVYLEI